jgi:hypothetical protein
MGVLQRWPATPCEESIALAARPAPLPYLFIYYYFIGENLVLTLEISVVFQF